MSEQRGKNHRSAMRWLSTLLFFECLVMLMSFYAFYDKQSIDDTKKEPPIPPSLASTLSHVPIDPIIREKIVQTILSRPLFTSSRRPPPIPEAKPSPYAELPRLAGIVIDGHRRWALLSIVKEGKYEIIHEGSHIGRYEVVSIQSSGVIIDGVDGTRILRPTFDPNSQAATPITPLPTMSTKSFLPSRAIWPNATGDVRYPGRPILLPAQPPGSFLRQPIQNMR